MRDATRTTVGYGMLGAVLGGVLLPWVYVVTVRAQIATTHRPMWVFVFFGVVLLPTLVFALYGRSRASSSSV